jgi:hypothetical protein
MKRGRLDCHRSLHFGEQQGSTQQAAKADARWPEATEPGGEDNGEEQQCNRELAASNWL